MKMKHELRNANRIRLDECCSPHQLEQVWDESGDIVLFFRCSLCGGEMSLIEAAFYESKPHKKQSLFRRWLKKFGKG